MESQTEQPDNTSSARGGQRSRTPLVFVVDDDMAICQLVGVLLGNEGYKVFELTNVQEALKLMDRVLPDIMLVDWMMPGLSGWDLLRHVRKKQSTRNIPVIMLTAKSDEDSIVAGLQGGADGYVTKPFSGRELVARIDALLRRTHSEADVEQITVGELLLDLSEHRLLVRGRELVVSPIEFKLLHFFMKHPNKVFSRNRILDNVWGVNAYVEERTVDVQVRRLRKSLEVCGCDQLIETVRGVGYRLRVPSSVGEPP